MIKGNFIDNLPKVYGIYTGGFIAFIILMAIGEQMGMSAKAIGICFVGFTIFIYAAIGWPRRRRWPRPFLNQYNKFAKR